MGQPAARLGDMHTCPLVNPGPVPHVGGPIVSPCVPTVLIGMMPAAVVGDMCTCVGPPDAIAKGSSTVLIGMRPAARMGDSTVHGGVIVVGCPTVLIGDMGMGTSLDGDLSDTGIIGALLDILGIEREEKYGDGIVIKGTPEYRETVRSQLDAMKKTDQGKQLLANLKASGKTVTIHAGKPPPNPPNAFAGPGKSTPEDFVNATNGGSPVFYGDGSPAMGPDGKQLIGTGKGVDSDVTYNPDQWTPDSKPSDVTATGDVILFHELNHSNNQMRGQYDGTPRSDGFDTNEEFNAIGPENKYRDETGVPRRTNHGDV